ncbi:MAG: hypothetical protein QQN46_04930 [Nitrosopumilus sp.]
MKRIKITLDDEVYAALKSHMMTRGLIQAMYGVSDAFMVKLIESIEAGLEEKHFFYVPRDKDETK